ncbi:signal peptidase I [Chloroflexota bacterium]
MKKIAEYLGYGLVVLVMLAAVLTYLGPHIGWQVDAVLSGSMEPELEVGSLVITRFVEPEEIAVGDIITFSSGIVDNNQITHRVVGIGHSSAIYFETKGDANEAPDPTTVPGWDLIGRVVFTAYYWGYITEFMKTPFGFLLAVVIPGTVIIAAYVISLWKFISQRNKSELDEATEEMI